MDEITKCINEEITPTLENLRIERQDYHKWQANNSEFELLDRIIIAYDYRNAEARIISVTGGDPTLLYLAHRKGWLKGPGAINAEWLEQRTAEGATHIAGSWDVIQSYAPFPDNPAKARLRQLLGPEGNAGPNYLVPLPLQNDAPDSPQ